MGSPPDESGLLRAVRAEARRVERDRVLDALIAEETRCDDAARAAASKRPALTGHGRRAAAMRQAIDVITSPANGAVHG